MNRFFLFVFIYVSLSVVAEANVQTKLDLQFAKYESAQAALLSRLQDESLPEGQRFISRDEWEGLIYLGATQDWTKSDLAELRKSQELRIAAALAKARKESAIDFGKIKSDRATVARFCSELPKGGMLHIHPAGTFDRETSSRLLAKINPVLNFATLLAYANNPQRGTLLYPNEVSWLQNQPQSRKYSLLAESDKETYLDFFVLPEGVHAFERFESVFTFINTALVDWDDLEYSWMQFAKRAAKENVLYVELTNGVNRQTASNFADVIEKIESETGVMIRMNRAFPRTANVAYLRSELKDLLRMPKTSWLVGIDLLSNETHDSALDKGQEIYGTLMLTSSEGAANLHRTMHAGEMGDVENARDAILLGAERLGHGVKLWEDPVALEYAVKKKTAIETNLTSNIKLGVVKSLADHPFLKFLRLGLPVSLSTDDEGIFQTDINRECEAAIENTDVTFSEMKQMSFNSIDTSFASSFDKSQLRKKLETQFAAFEKNWVH